MATDWGDCMVPVQAQLTRALMGAIGLAAMGAAFSATEPVQGSTYVYRLVNGYSNEVVGQVRYEVAKVQGNSYVVAVSPENRAAGQPRTEVYAKDGNWLRRPLASH